MSKVEIGKNYIYIYIADVVENAGVDVAVNAQGCYVYPPEQLVQIKAQMEAYRYIYVDEQRVPDNVCREATMTRQGEDKDAIIDGLTTEVFALERKVSEGSVMLAEKEGENSRLRERVGFLNQNEQKKNEELEALRKKVRSLQTMLGRTRQVMKEPEASPADC